MKLLHREILFTIHWKYKEIVHDSHLVINWCRFNSSLTNVYATKLINFLGL